MQINNAKLTNLRILQFIAHKLGELTEEVVFIGGSTTALLITDANISDVRFTFDVDCIIDIVSSKDYRALEKALRAKGFKQSLNEKLICRWFYDDAVLDIMPTDEKILGFSNRWYKTAMQNASEYQLEDNYIRVISPPYFLATKLSAFHDRGSSDYLSSHDFEDIITVIDGRAEIIDEVKNSEEALSNFLCIEFKKMLGDSNFYDALPGHLVYYGLQANERAKILTQRIKKMAGISE